MSYLRDVLEIAASAKPGTGLRVTVLHDDWCALLAGSGPCDCEPEYVVRPDEAAKDSA